MITPKHLGAGLKLDARGRPRHARLRGNARSAHLLIGDGIAVDQIIVGVRVSNPRASERPSKRLRRKICAPV